MARWIVKNRTQYPNSCRYCNKYGKDCRAVECLACGSRQCDGNGRCFVCFSGILTNGSYNLDNVYSYKVCASRAVGHGIRGKRYVCKAHAAQQGICKPLYSRSWCELMLVIDDEWYDIDLGTKEDIHGNDLKYVLHSPGIVNVYQMEPAACDHTAEWDGKPILYDHLNVKDINIAATPWHAHLKNQIGYSRAQVCCCAEAYSSRCCLKDHRHLASRLVTTAVIDD